MKIGIDVTPLMYQGSGVATYTFNLVSSLLQLDSHHTFKLFYSSFRRPQDFKRLEILKQSLAEVYDFRFNPLMMELMWNTHHLLPMNYLMGEIDVYHSSDYLRPPLSSNTLGITTIHDLTWKKYPEWHTQKIVHLHHKKMEKTIKYGDSIIVPSKSTKLDLLIEYPNVIEDKVEVIYEGIENRFQPVIEPLALNILKKYKFNPEIPYLLYVGAIEPRKNLERIIFAFEKLIELPRYEHLQLVLAGRAGWKNENIFSLMNKPNIRDRIKFIGYVLDEDLPALYSQALLSLYLSLYEGFGLPPLESLACGTPVLTSNISSLPEIIDEKYLVDPTNVTKITEKLNKLLQSESKINSDYYREKYNWKATASNFLSFIEDKI